MTKYEYLWVVQGYYSPYGWEELTAHVDRKMARDDAKAYRDNDAAPIRVVHRRVPREV